MSITTTGKGRADGPSRKSAKALADVLQSWITTSRTFQGSGVYPIRSALVEGSLDRVSYWLLRELAHGGPRRLGDLAGATSMTISHASRTVDALVRRGLIARTVPDDDRRVTVLDLTERGRALSQEIEGRFLSLLADRFSGFEESELITFATLFGRFADELVLWSEEEGRGAAAP